MSCCTGPCFIRYAMQVGKIIVFVWNNPLKDILKEVIEEIHTVNPSELTFERTASLKSEQLSRSVTPFLT